MRYSPLLAVILVTLALAAGATPGRAAPGVAPVAGAAGSVETAADVNCSGALDSVDSLIILRFVSGLSVNQQQPCPVIGSVNAGLTFGDTNCDHGVNSVDALALLRFIAGLSQLRDCAVSALFPGEVNGHKITVTTATGGELEAADERWTDLFAVRGVTAADVKVALGTPPADSGLEFQMGMYQTAGADWAPALQTYRDNTEASSPGTLLFEDVTISGRAVIKVTQPADGTVPPVYYYAAGDTLFWFVTGDAQLAEQVIAGLPAAATQAGAGAEGSPPPGVGPLNIMLIEQPLPPICVAGPPQPIRGLVIDVLSGAPSAVNIFTTTAISGALTPPTYVGPMLFFNYEAQRFGSGNERIQIDVRTPLGGFGISIIPFSIQHCLAGTWQDGPRVLTISHSGTSVAAEITSGELSCGETGTAFTGSLDVASFSGGDLKICNPPECVDAGYLEKAVLAPYSATVADDGKSISLEWTNQFFDLVYEDDRLVSCPPSHTTTESFTITRLSSAG